MSQQAQYEGAMSQVEHREELSMSQVNDREELSVMKNNLCHMISNEHGEELSMS